MSTIKSTIVGDNRINANVSPPSKIVPKHVTLHNVSKADVGLSNVDDTRDLNKPISHSTQAALDLKANQSTTYTKTEVDNNIENLVAGAPGQLDTLNELAAALGNDDNFATSITNLISTKAPINNPSFTGYVGIGREPLKLLDIKGGDFRITSSEPAIFLNDTDNNSDFGIKNNNGSFEISDTTNELTRLAIDSNGNVGIGTTSPEGDLHIKDISGRAVNLKVEGPVSVTHDLFKNSGVTGGFADNSNHFHDITRINRITQQGAGEVKNIERVQEKYYAIQSNNLKNNKAAFWNWHRVTRSIASNSVSLTNLVGWNVSAIQDFDYDASTRPNGRTQTGQVNFSQSEATTFTFTSGNNAFSQDDLLQIKINIDFEGAIVAATLFAKVTAIPTIDTATVILYGGNYKSLNEVADGSSQTAITENFSVRKIDENQYMTLASGTGIDVLSDSTRTTTTDTFKLTFASAHNLELNDNITVLTDATGGFKVAESAFVKEVVSSAEATFVYGRIFEPASRLALSDIGSGSVVGILKGSLDGLHRETAGDQLMHFNADNQGRYKSYQIGPGSEVGADCIAIGKNVYNKDASTIKIGYDNNMLNIDSAGIDVAGNITATDITANGSITGATLVGNVTGNVTGDLTGNVTGNVTGDLTGNVTGNVTGDVTGDVTGNLTGTIQTAAQSHITSLGQLGALNLSDAAVIYHGSDWTIKTPGTSPNQTFEIYSEVNGATEFKIADTGDITAGNIAATLTTAAQTNITSVGTLTSLTTSGNITAPRLVTNEIQCIGTTSGTAQPITYDSKEHRFRDYDETPNNLMVIKKTDGVPIGKVGINHNNPVSALHVVGGHTSGGGISNEALRVVGSGLFTSTDDLALVVARDTNNNAGDSGGHVLKIKQDVSTSNASNLEELNIGFVGSGGGGIYANSTALASYIQVANNKHFEISTGGHKSLSLSGSTGSASFISGASFGGNVTISGNLQVSGTTATVNQTNLDVSDNIIGLNRGATTNVNDSGIIIERGSTGDNAAIIWDESDDKFVLGTTTASPGSVGNIAVTEGALKANSLDLTNDITCRNVQLGQDGHAVLFMGVSDANYRRALYAVNDNHFVTNRHTDGDLILMSNNGSGGGETERLRFKAGAGTQNAYFSNVNVGIGTTSPGNKLHIVDTSAGNVTYPIRIQNDTTTNNSGVGIEFGISTDDAYTNARIQATREDSQASAELSFQTKSDSSTNLTERMRIDRNGNVGIGTDAPGRPLHVEFSGDNGVKIESSDNHASLYLDSHSSKGQYIRFSENDTNKYWINSNSGKLVFRPAGTSTTANQIIFDSSGNVGIGKTPSSDVELDVNGDIAASGDFIGLYHKELAADNTSESGSASNYYHDSYNGERHLNGFLKNSRSDIIRYRPIDNYEYWNGSAWIADSSKIDEVKKLLDGRQDTRYNVPYRDYKFRFTVTPSTNWPTIVKVAMQTHWSGSSYPGSKMIVEEYSNGAWETRVTAKFGNGNSTPLETTDNNCANWGLNFLSTERLHTGNGSGSQATRITVDFYGWSPSNSSYVTIPLQNLFITSNYAGTENTDYTNLLDYDRNISAPNDLSVSGNITASGQVYGSIYPIWAEESYPMSDNATEWSFGNGDETPAAHGIPIGFRSKLLKVSVNIEITSGTTTEDIEVEVYKNGVATGAKGIITSGLSSSDSKKSQVTNVSASNIVFEENDIINFKTLTEGNATSASCRVCAWLQTIV